MSDLPGSWKKTTFGEVTEIIGGGTPPSKDPSNFTTKGGMPWITPSDLSGYEDIFISRGARNLTKKGLQESSAKVLPTGSVLFSSRAPIGYVAVAGNKVSTSQGFKNFVLPEELDSKFIYFYLRHIRPVAEMMATGTTFKELSASNAGKLPLLVAPLNEQKRIAEKLEHTLIRVASCHSRLDHLPQIIQNFRQSVLTAATSGRLTEDWRDKQRIALDNWDVTNFASVCREITVGYVGKMASEYRKSGVPFLRSMNVRPFHFDPTDLKFITKRFHKKILKSRLHPGDVVIVRSGAPGQCCVIPAELPEANCSDLVIVRVGPKLMPEFAVVFINSEVSQSFVRSEQVGVAQQHFNVGSMKKAPLHLPSLEEQAEIVRRVEKMFAYAESVERRCHSALEQVARLTSSLFDKAFRGELVEQDLADEPAEKLLQRIVERRRSEEMKMNNEPRKKKIKKMGTVKSRQPLYETLIASKSAGLTPNQLFSISGYEAAFQKEKNNQELLDAFYEELRLEMQKGRIKHDRRNNKTIYLVGVKT